jgi:DNA-binding response OmpR family regulator
MRKRVLIVEDDPTITRLVCDNLTYEGFEVDCAADGETAIAKARSFAADLVLLDLMLPRMDGLEVCRALSGTRPRTAIVIVTARGRNEDKVRGLELGADDYITKPFAFEELLARIHAVLRRTQPGLERLSIGGVVVDFRMHAAWKQGQDLALTTREFELLHYLAERRGQVVTRDELLRVVWGYSGAALTRTVDNCIARLRRKVEADPRTPRFLLTMHGDGYALVLPEDTG